MPEVVYHGGTHRPKLFGGTDPLRPLGYYEIKVFADANALDGLLPAQATDVVTGDGKFIFAIPEDLHGTDLVRAHAFITTAGSLVQVQIRNVTQGHDMLSTKVSIDAGDFTSYASATPPVVNQANAEVEEGDLIAIDVDAAGGGAQGLGVMLVFTAL